MWRRATPANSPGETESLVGPYAALEVGACYSIVERGIGRGGKPAQTTLPGPDPPQGGHVGAPAWPKVVSRPQEAHTVQIAFAWICRICLSTIAFIPQSSSQILGGMGSRIDSKPCQSFAAAEIAVQSFRMDGEHSSRASFLGEHPFPRNDLLHAFDGGAGGLGDLDERHVRAGGLEDPAAQRREPAAIRPDYRQQPCSGQGAGRGATAGRSGASMSAPNDDRETWRGVTMTPRAAAHIERIRRSLTQPDHTPSTRR